MLTEAKIRSAKPREKKYKLYDEHAVAALYWLQSPTDLGESRPQSRRILSATQSCARGSQRLEREASNRWARQGPP
jgi:hypothetical protein